MLTLVQGSFSPLGAESRDESVFQDGVYLHQMQKPRFPVDFPLDDGKPEPFLKIKAVKT